MRYLTMHRVGRSIVLVGMMGSGKSSVGCCLQRRTGLTKLETDEMVASRFGMSVHEIFLKHGEKKFRESEAEALRSLSRTKRAVIATGGGVVLRKKNMAILKQLGLIVWLDGNEEALFARASRRTNRPLLQTKDPRKAFSQILGERRTLYAKIADIRIDTSELTCEEVAIAILSKLSRADLKGALSP